jgi:hypothetical protein
MARPSLARLIGPTRLPLLVAGPAITVFAVWGSVLAIAVLSGTHPVWGLRPDNLAEAAAFRDGAAVVRRVEAGEDLNQPGSIRERIILPERATLTPIEAAAISGHTGMVQLLIDLGATADAASWERAFCATDDESIRELLDGHRPPDARNECASR